MDQSKHHFKEDGSPIPSTAASTNELIELSKTLAEFNAGIIQVNGGSMGAEISPEDNYAFLRRLAQASGRPVLFNSIIQRWQLPHIWQQALDLGASCLADGYRIHGTTSTLPVGTEFTLMNVQVIFDKFPTWRPLMFATREERIAGFQDSQLRPKLRYEACDDPSRQSFHKRWDLVTVVSAKRSENQKWQGKNIAEIATALDKHPIDAFLDLALSENLDTVFKTVIANGDKAAVGQMLLHPAGIVGTSDAGAHTAFIADYGYCTEFAGPWVRNHGLMPLEQAINRLTLVPASLLGLHDRGQIRPGFKADLVIFDPETIGPGETTVVHDYPAGEPRMVQSAVGIMATIVNGEVLVENGRHTGALPGKVLRNRGLASADA